MRAQGKRETEVQVTSRFLPTYQHPTKHLYVLLSHSDLRAPMKMTVVGFVFPRAEGAEERALHTVPRR